MKTIKKVVLCIMFLCVTAAITACSSDNDFSFQYWNQDADSFKAITAYVEDVTDEQSDNFIPEEDRIAVFDMDGTLVGERGPVYFNRILYAHRVLDDPECEATPEMIECAETIRTSDDYGESIDGKTFAECNAKAFAGMTIDEFDKYVKDYAKKTPCMGYENLTYAEDVFLPMTEIVDYLNENGFTAYVCSGTDRLTCRAILDGRVNIEPGHIIGGDVALCPEDYEGSVMDSYEYGYENELVRSDERIVECWEGSKVNCIAVDIGKQPVMVFGNSMGDASMAIYATDDNPYKSMAVMVMGDDTEREHGDVAEYEKRKAVWDRYGWTVISMKNDWKTIYGEKVKVID